MLGLALIIDKEVVDRGEFAAVEVVVVITRLEDRATASDITNSLDNKSLYMLLAAGSEVRLTR